MKKPMIKLQPVFQAEVMADACREHGQDPSLPCPVESFFVCPFHDKDWCIDVQEEWWAEEVCREMDN